MSTSHKLLTLLTACLLVSSLFAKPDFKVKDIDHISSIALGVEKIMQGHDGFIWFATKNGLYRYDSYAITNFKLYCSEHPFMDNEGNFWCIEDNDAFLFDTKSCKYIKVLEKFKKKNKKDYIVNKIRTMANGYTWLLCEDNICLKVNNKNPQDDVSLIYKGNEPITTIFTDSMHNTWLLTESTTYLYAENKMHKYEIPLTANFASNDRVWFLRRDGRLCFFSYGDRKIHLSKELSSYKFVALRTPSSQTLFAVTETESFLIGKKGKAPQRFATTDVDNFFEDPEGKLWYFPNAKFYCEDSNGTVWAAMRDGQLLYLDKADQTLKKSANADKMAPELSFAIQNYKQYFIDYQKNLWLVTPTRVVLVSFFKRPYEKVIDGLSVRSMFKDKKGRIWVAGSNEPLVRIYDKNLKDFNYLSENGRLCKSLSMIEGNVQEMFEDSRGTIWFGTKRHGIIRLIEKDDAYEVSKFDNESTRGTLPSNAINDISEDKYGRLWLATDKGLCCMLRQDNGGVKFVTCKESKPLKNINKSVGTAVITSKGVLFAGTPAGLLVADVNNKNVNSIIAKRHRRDDARARSLSANTVMGISELKNGQIVVCTETGGFNTLLSKDWLADELEFSSINSQTGAAFDACRWAIEYDNQIFLTSSSQLMKLGVNKDGSYMSSSYVNTDGLLFSEAQPLQFAGSKWLFGLYDGCILLDISDLKNSKVKPKLHISSVFIEDKGADYSYMNKDTIILEPGERNLRIDFSVLDFSGHYDAQYAVKNMKEDRPWIYIGENRHLALMDIAPGEYVWGIRYTNSEGEWMDDESTLTIIVKPSFWETGWAQLLYVIIALLLAYFGLRHYNYIMNIKRQQKDALTAYMELLDHRHEESVAYENRRKELLANVKAESQNDAIIKRIMEFIDEHIGDSDVNIDDMAAAAAVSRSLLHVKIKQIFGLTPGKLINEARIQKACTMLEDESVSITEIAFACGFSDPKYFSRSFKQSVGETPTDYRLKHCKRLD